MKDDKLILFKVNDTNINIDVKFENDTVWLTQQQIADLFNVNKSTISRHIKNIFDDEELNPISTVAKNATIQIEGKRKVERLIDFYNRKIHKRI